VPSITILISRPARRNGAGAIREAAKAAIEKLGAEIQQAGTEPTLLRRQAQIAGHNDQRSLL